MSFKFSADKLKTIINGYKEKIESTTTKQDERFWSPAKMEENSKETITYEIRFLPVITKNGNYEVPEIKLNIHKFKSPITGRWIYHNCPKTIGLPCPTCELSAYLKFNSTDPKDNADSKNYYRNEGYISNILVIKDGATEKRKENEGKVFLFKYGKKIHDKLQEMMYPSDGSEGVVHYDPENGLNFKLKVKMDGKYPNFDSSEFARTSSKIASNDKKIEEIITSTYSLETEFGSDSVYKTYEELEALLKETVFGEGKKSAPKDPKPTTSAKKKESPKEEDVPTFTSESQTEEAENEEEIPETGNGADDDFLSELEKELGM